jgi:hypothetical protein
MRRILQAELLDLLPPDHPDALHSRRDLRLINRIMGNHRWIARTVAPLLGPREIALEIGAGDGVLGLQLAAQSVAVDGLDLWPRPATWPAARAWHSADLRAVGGYAGYPVIVGNLIFHQFNAEELAELGAAIRQSARVIIACEPARQRLSQVLMAVFGPPLGAAAVTQHDARVSVAAGFRGDELSRALGLRPEEWDIRCGSTALGAYRMVARRRG